MEKSYVSVFLLLIVISCALAKDAGKKDSKDTPAKPKLPQTLSRGKKQLIFFFFKCNLVSISFHSSFLELC